MILTDNETKVDLLNNEAIAATIIGMLRAKPDHPVTIGVHGDWGAGKSSVLEMIEAGFADQDDVLCLKFNGWRFQGFEDAKIALIEGIVTGLVEKRPALKKGKRAAEARGFLSAVRPSCATVGELLAFWPAHGARRRLISGRTSSITASSAMALPRAASRRSSSCAIVSPSRPTSATRTFLP